MTAVNLIVMWVGFSSLSLTSVFPLSLWITFHRSVIHYDPHWLPITRIKPFPEFLSMQSNRAIGPNTWTNRNPKGNCWLISALIILYLGSLRPGRLSGLHRATIWIDLSFFDCTVLFVYSDCRWGVLCGIAYHHRDCLWMVIFNWIDAKSCRSSERSTWICWWIYIIFMIRSCNAPIERNRTREI